MDNTNSNNVKGIKHELRDKYEQQKQLIRDSKNIESRKYDEINNWINNKPKNTRVNIHVNKIPELGDSNYLGCYDKESSNGPPSGSSITPAGYVSSVKECEKIAQNARVPYYAMIPTADNRNMCALMTNKGFQDAMETSKYGLNITPIWKANDDKGILVGDYIKTDFGNVVLYDNTNKYIANVIQGGFPYNPETNVVLKNELAFAQNYDKSNISNYHTALDNTEKKKIELMCNEDAKCIGYTVFETTELINSNQVEQEVPSEETVSTIEGFTDEKTENMGVVAVDTVSSDPTESGINKSINEAPIVEKQAIEAAANDYNNTDSSIEKTSMFNQIGTGISSVTDKVTTSANNVTSSINENMPNTNVHKYYQMYSNKDLSGNMEDYMETIGAQDADIIENNNYPENANITTYFKQEDAPKGVLVMNDNGVLSLHHANTIDNVSPSNNVWSSNTEGLLNGSFKSQDMINKSLNNRHYLLEGEIMRKGDYLVSKNGRCALIINTKGELCIIKFVSSCGNTELSDTYSKSVNSAKYYTLDNSDYKKHKNADVAGQDLNLFTNSFYPGDCIFECNKDPNCKAAVHNEKAKTCLLKSEYKDINYDNEYNTNVYEKTTDMFNRNTEHLGKYGYVDDNKIVYLNKEEDIKYKNKYDKFKHTVLLHPSNEKLQPYQPYNIKISGMTPNGTSHVSGVKYTSRRCREMCNEDDECGGFYYGKVSPPDLKNNTLLNPSGTDINHGMTDDPKNIPRGCFFLKKNDIKGDKLYSNTMLPVHTFVKQQQYMTQDSITTDVVGIDSYQFNEYIIAENNINRDTEVGPNLIRERASEKIDKINQQQISLGNEINELEYKKKEARKENNGIIEMKNNIDDLQEGFTMNDELETRKVHYKESLRKVEKEYFSLMAWSVAALTTIVIGTHFIKK